MHCGTVSGPKRILPLACTIDGIVSGPNHTLPLACTIDGTVSAPKRILPLACTIDGTVSGPKHTLPLACTIDGTVSGPKHTLPLACTIDGTVSGSKHTLPLACTIDGTVSGPKQKWKQNPAFPVCITINYWVWHVLIMPPHNTWNYECKHELGQPWFRYSSHGPLASYTKLRVAHAAECQERFPHYH